MALAVLAAGVTAPPAQAQAPSDAHTRDEPQSASEIVSPRPDSVAVTIYRDPRRGNGGGFNLRLLKGFAVITETRKVTVPAGPVTIRFAGVAEGMVAVSAVIRGLPGGIIEQNRDKKLLSPGALVDGTLGNRVMLRRTDPATGAVSERDAVIRSGSAGALVVETEDGIEALQCAGLPEKIIYERLPGGLFATPVLSVDTVQPVAATVDVTLTYLAAGFDWNADYVVTLGDDGRSLDLFAWLTLANGNAETFPDAELLVVAGTLNTGKPAQSLADAPRAMPLSIRCWPRGSTAEGVDDIPLALPPPLMSPMMARSAKLAMADEQELAVMGIGTQAELEALGDLKLYRVPFATTVASSAQKQVALLDQRKVPVRLVYRGNAYATGAGSLPLEIEVRMDNRAASGLGLPLPSGRITVFGGAADDRSGDLGGLGDGLLIGQGRMRDYAVGQEVKFTIGSSAAVQLTADEIGPARAGGWTSFRLLLTNANPDAVAVEIDLEQIASADIRTTKASAAAGRIIRRDGKHIWKIMLPANATATLAYDTRAKER